MEGHQISTVELTELHTPNVKDCFKPAIGMFFMSEESAHDFYNNYGRLAGFSVRREHASLSGSQRIMVDKKFACNKAGNKVDDSRRVNAKHKRANTRTDCPACMYIKLNRASDIWTCVDFEPAHNHQLHLPEVVHMMRSQRRLSNQQAIDATLAVDAKDNCLSSTDFHVDEEDPNLVASARFRTICPLFVQMATRVSSHSQEAYDLLANGVSELCRVMDSFMISHPQNTSCDGEDSENEGHGFDPDFLTARGIKNKSARGKSGRRKLSWHEAKNALKASTSQEAPAVTRNNLSYLEQSYPPQNIQTQILDSSSLPSYPQLSQFSSQGGVQSLSKDEENYNPFDNVCHGGPPNYRYD